MYDVNWEGITNFASIRIVYSGEESTIGGGDD